MAVYPKHMCVTLHELNPTCTIFYAQPISVIYNDFFFHCVVFGWFISLPYNKCKYMINNVIMASEVIENMYNYNTEIIFLAANI